MTNRERAIEVFNEACKRLTTKTRKWARSGGWIEFCEIRIAKHGPGGIDAEYVANKIVSAHCMCGG